ncbi:YigZ family protein [Saxibacter everestensis]|uniref:YigZ family protein n=1 Tax=Saxibacter everestensis TaxID=2909229 RepID=A0ABY8QUH1_9MICO|nr:YigZ family protein [Brevibacteriaceae bacterium ZFBP1038]
MEPMAAGTSYAGYHSIAVPVGHELEVKRSRFIAELAPVETEEAARSFISAQRRVHSKARHHCTAFVLGERSEVRRSNDDGEPSGTAGLPILETLTGRGLSNIVAVVIRYFGGTLLGTGGLIRAYGGAVSAALDRAAIVDWRPVQSLTITADYSNAAQLEKLIHERRWTLLTANYAAEVTLSFGVPPGEADAAGLAVQDVSSRHNLPTIGSVRYVKSD